MNYPDSTMGDVPHIMSIATYFNGKSLFITGGTGFIGKVVVEKLLRTCPNLKNIYFLIRPKKGQSCEERIDKIFTLPVGFALYYFHPIYTVSTKKFSQKLYRRFLISLTL